MRTRFVVALIGLGLVASACEREAALQSDAQIASYGVGLDIGGSLKPAAGHLDVDAFTRGVQDALAGSDPALADSIIQGALERFSQTIQEAMASGAAEEAQKNLQAGQAFMAQNATKPGVTTTASGVQYEVLQEGTGPRPGPEDQATIHYRGTLIDGTEFDSSYSRGQPYQSPVSGFISGFTEALMLMPVGSKYRVVIPSHLAYGENAGPPLGPNATLVFEIEMISIP